MPFTSSAASSVSTRVLRRVALACCTTVYLAMPVANAADPDFSTKPASPATLAAQARARAAMPADDGRDMAFATQGFIATRKDPIIRAADGHVVWNMAQYDWVKGDAPETVNPSLWRHVKVLNQHGLFKIADGIWQVRGFDASNMLVIRGKTGWVIADPLFAPETAAAALEVVNAQLGKRPITGVIYTHSHGDHFGGVRGIVDPKALPPIVSPYRLIEETVSEFLLAGNSAGRRASYQFGVALDRNATGKVSGGIVIDSAAGLPSLIEPSDYIRTTGEKRTIDGVNIEFQMVPETEAPSEMNFYLPDHKFLYVSEIVSCTMHNVQTPRGALVRDVLSWAGYLTEAIQRYGDAESLATGHCWPRFGNKEVVKHLSLQRDNYKFIHDQSMRMLNRGETPTEIAEQLQPPPAIADEWSNHGYYGTLRHNAKGVYQRYVGWWDANPAHFNMYPPVEQGKRYVRAMGGAQGVLKEARRAMDEGDYRWSAEILNHLVFADPANGEAKALLADSFEQLGYQCESAIWRNIYLSGARELRGKVSSRFPQASMDMVNLTPTKSYLDMVATRIVPAKIGDAGMTIALTVNDTKETALVTLEHAVLVPEMGKTTAQPTVRINATKLQVMGLFLQKAPMDALIAKGMTVDGDRAALQQLLDALEIPPPDYSIVTP